MLYAEVDAPSSNKREVRNACYSRKKINLLIFSRTIQTY